MAYLKLNIFNVLIFVGMLVGIGFGSFILRKNNTKLSRLLAGFFLSLCISIIQLVYRDMGLNRAIIEIPRLPTDILLVAFIFVFVELYTKYIYRKSALYIAFSVFLAVYTFNLCYHFQVFSMALETYLAIDLLIATIIPVVSLGLMIPIFVNVYGVFNKNEKNSVNRASNARFQWLFNLIYGALFLTILWVLNVVFARFVFNGDNLPSYYVLWLSATAALIWWAYSGIPIEVLLDKESEDHKP